MSGVIIGEKICSLMEEESATIGAFGHGFTTSGHPVAAAAALANLAIVEREGLVDRAASSGQTLINKVRTAVGDHPNVGNVRGDGLMVGIELVADRAGRRHFPPEAQAGPRLATLIRQEGVLVRALPTNDVIALSPAFTINDEEMSAIASAIARALNQLPQAITS